MHVKEEFTRIGRHARAAFVFAFRLIRQVAISVGWLLVFCLMPGCLSVIDHKDQGPLVRTEHAVRDEGKPSALLLSHPDRLGWTVITRQPLVREIHEVRQTQGMRHTYYWNPLTLPAGVFACPASVWGWAWSLLTPLAPLDTRRNLLEFTKESCLLLLMVARTKSEVFDEETSMDTLIEQDSRPFRDGSLTLEWQGEQTVTVHYPIGTDGRTVVRVSHLITALLHNGHGGPTLSGARIHLVVSNGTTVLAQWALAISPAMLTAAVHETDHPSMAPTSRWPKPLVIKPRFDDRHAQLEDRLIRTLLTHHLPLAASDESQRHLRQELELNLSGAIEDHLAPSPGHWTAPSVLLTVKTQQSDGSTDLSLQFLNIRTGELLAHILVQAGPHALELAIDVAIAKVDELLRKLGPFIHAAR